MGRASSSKKVARAQRAAATSSSSRSWVWPVAVVGVVALGFLLIVASRESRPDAEAPLLGDHWHAAYGIDICGSWEPPYSDAKPDESGIHAHGDGLIHIHPFGTRYTGSGANLAAFADQTGMELSDDSITTQGGQSYENGDDCDGEEGIVRLAVWEDAGDNQPQVITQGIADYAPADGEVVTIAFTAPDAELRQPPSVGNRPVDVEPSQGGATTTAPPPADTTETTAPTGDTADTTETTAAP